MTQQCIQCQKPQFGKHIKSPIDKSQGLDGMFTHFHIDIVGSLPNVYHLTYMLSIEDRFSRWPAVFLTPNNSAEIIEKVLLDNWISKMWSGIYIFYWQRITDSIPIFQGISQHTRRQLNPNYSIHSLYQWNFRKLPQLVQNCNIHKH